jgi:hypothetical protein
LWVRIPAKAQRGICEQDTCTLKSQLGVAIISRIACSTPNLSKKKKNFKTISHKDISFPPIFYGKFFLRQIMPSNLKGLGIKSTNKQNVRQVQINIQQIMSKYINLIKTFNEHHEDTAVNIRKIYQ